MVQTKRPRSCTMASCSSTATGTRFRRSTPQPAICCGSTPAGCRWASHPASSGASRCTAPGSTSPLPMPHRRPRRQNRERRLGHHRGRSEGGRPHDRWSARGQRQGDDRKPPDAVQAGITSRGSMRRRAKKRGVSIPSPGRRSRRQQLERYAPRETERRIGLDPRRLRSGPEPGVVRSRQHLRHGTSAQPSQQAGHHERWSLSGLHARLESRHREARLALSTPGKRPVGSRLGLRTASDAGAGERRDEERRADRRQADDLGLGRHRNRHIRLLIRPGARHRPPERRDAD